MNSRTNHGHVSPLVLRGALWRRRRFAPFVAAVDVELARLLAAARLLPAGSRRLFVRSVSDRRSTVNRCS